MPGTLDSLAGSAIVIPVPEADPVVDRWRRRFDPGAVAGIPAHITLIVPWLARDRVDDEKLAELRHEMGATKAFDFSLTQVRWFDRRVLWLAPDPAEPFVALTARIAGRFATPPWGGTFETVVPHLTVARVTDREDLTPVAANVTAALPVRCRAEEAWVMVGDGHRWQVHSRASLG